MICPCQHASPRPGGAPYSVFPGNNEQNAEGVDHNHGESEGYPDPHTQDKNHLYGLRMTKSLMMGQLPL